MSNCDTCTSSVACTLCTNSTFLMFNSTGCVTNCSINDIGTMDDSANYKCVKSCPTGIFFFLNTNSNNNKKINEIYIDLKVIFKII